MTVGDVVKGNVQNRLIVSVDWDGCLFDHEDYGEVMLRPNTITAIKWGREEDNIIFIVNVPKTVKHGTAVEALRRYDIDYVFYNQDPKVVAGIFGPEVNCISLYWNTPDDIWRSKFLAASDLLRKHAPGPSVVALDAAEACEEAEHCLRKLAGSGISNVGEGKLVECIVKAYLHLHAVERTYNVDTVLPKVLSALSMDIINK